MKKIFTAIFALTAAVSLLTSCGQEEESSSLLVSVSESSESSKDAKDEAEEPDESESSEAEETTEATTEETTEKTTEETTKKAKEKTTREKTTDGAESPSVAPKVSEVSEVEDGDKYKRVFVEIFEVMKEGDRSRILEYSVPKTTFEALKEAHLFDFLVDSMVNVGIEEEEYDFESLSVISIRDATEEEKKEASRLYSRIEGLSKEMLSVGVTYDDIINRTATDEQLSQLEKMPCFSESDDIELIVEFEEYKFVTFYADGEEVEIPFYRQSGDVLKIDFATIGLI